MVEVTDLENMLQIRLCKYGNEGQGSEGMKGRRENERAGEENHARRISCQESS